VTASLVLDREAIYSALFARLQAKLGAACGLYSRRFLDLDQIPASQQPALLLVATEQSPDYPGHGQLPAKYDLRALAILYARAQPDDPAGPEPLLHQLVAQLDAALIADPGEGPFSEVATTLGGLVTWARIAGPVELHPGADADQAAALVPIEMLAVP
jgi:hypothetical protein